MFSKVMLYSLNTGSHNIQSQQLPLLETNHQQQQLLLEEETSASWDVLQEVSQLN
jgi:hypothetical protein